MRGTLFCVIIVPYCAGIIPAYAGNTSRLPSRLGNARDHPRVCGEHCEGLFVASGDVGSSPRMRGTPARYCASRSNAGIIPAYAGNTSTTRARRCLPRDHPRVCGEHQSGAPIQFVGLGIIPAYAGNTVEVVCVVGHVRDHPRVCGEHRDLAAVAFAWLGSSPRMRGTRDGWRVCGVQPGIIPAYAGNTAVPRNRLKSSRDHPRVCGEHPVQNSTALAKGGSSPRMRGTPVHVRPRARRHGIIPAYAGNTMCATPALPSTRDHPRVCGEHVCGQGIHVV